MNPCEVKESFSCDPFHKDQAQCPTRGSITHGLNAVKITENNLAKELNSLKARQDLVTLHHKLLKEVNTLTDKDGTLDGEKLIKVIQDLKSDMELKYKGSPEKLKPFMDVLDDALKMGHDIRKDATSFTKDQRDRFIDNIKMDMEELNSENEMQIRKLIQLVNQQQECHHHARQMEKTDHERNLDVIRKMDRRN